MVFLMDTGDERYEVYHNYGSNSNCVTLNCDGTENSLQGCMIRTDNCPCTTNEYLSVVCNKGTCLAFFCI